MKITVIKKAAPGAKPANVCPWFIDDDPSPRK